MNSKSKWCSIDLGDATWHKNCSPSRGDLSHNQIFVGGLGLTVTDQQLCARFVQLFGFIAEARIMRFRDGRSRGFGFVKFNNHGDYNRALEMQKMDFDGNIIEFRPCISKDEASKEAKELRKRKLILYEIPTTTTKSQLLDYFNMYGEIVRVKIFLDSVTNKPIGQGYVEFKDDFTVRLVLAALSKNPLRINGKVVGVYSAEGIQAAKDIPSPNSSLDLKKFSAAMTKLSLTNAPPSMAGLCSMAKDYEHIQTPVTFMSNLSINILPPSDQYPNNYRFNLSIKKSSLQSAKYLLIWTTKMSLRATN
jgi:RNA recognition motif-containing protein